MKPFKNLSAQENRAFLKFPVYVSLLAANLLSDIDETEKETAIKFAHTKTYTCNPLLTKYYKEVDKVFEKNLEQLDNFLPKEKKRRIAAIKWELFNLEKIILKLGADFSEILHESMNSFKEHVSNAHHNVLVDIIFPIPIPGLTDG